MPRGSYLLNGGVPVPADPQPSRRISILRTEGEWKHVMALLYEQKQTDIHGYLHREISRMTNIFKDCEVCITPADGHMKSFRHNIPTHIYEKLLPIAQKMGKPVATIVDDLLITPLLLKDRDAAL